MVLRRYLDEFVFPWNRRRHAATAFDTLPGIGTHLRPAGYYVLRRTTHLISAVGRRRRPFIKPQTSTPSRDTVRKTYPQTGTPDQHMMQPESKGEAIQVFCVSDNSWLIRPRTRQLQEVQTGRSTSMIDGLRNSAFAIVKTRTREHMTLVGKLPCHRHFPNREVLFDEL